MKMKKILAVALAATTALSSGTAYNLLGASTAYAYSGVEKDDTFTDLKENVDNYHYDATYTYSVIDEIADNATSGGNVKLVGVDFDDSDEYDSDKGHRITIPASVTTEVSGKKYEYNVTEVDLDGTSFSDLDQVKKIQITDSRNVKKVTLKNFENSDNKFELVTTASAVNLDYVGTKLETVDFTNSNISLNDVEGFIARSTNSLETLNLNKRIIVEDNTDSKADDEYVLNLSQFKNLKEVGLEDNSNIKELTVVRGSSTLATSGASIKPYALALNISGDTDTLKKLNVYGQYSKSTKPFDGYNKGVSFITDGGDEGSRNVDLSGYSIEELNINGAGIESLVLPGDAKNVDVSDNFLTKVDASSTSELKTLIVKNNMLSEIDVNGLNDMSKLDVSNNFLTSLDISGCDGLNGNLVASNNYIAKDNFTKASSGQSGASLGEQATVTKANLAMTGDAGLKSNNGNNVTGIIKIGGTATVFARFKIENVPEGFAEKFAETISWKEANENGGAITLGEPTVVKAENSFEGRGDEYNKYNATVVVSAPITGADAKAAQEKITINAGNKKYTVGVQADNAIIISYDTATNLPADKTADCNGDIKDDAYIFVPQQAAILPSSGTASVKLDAVADNSVLNNDNIKGAKLESWNTAADGTGTGYKFNKVGSGKTAKLSEDTALTAIYKEWTYSVNFDANNGGYKKSGSAPASMKNINWGEEVALSSNGWTTSIKVDGNDEDNTFLGWIDNGSKKGEASKIFGDGEVVYGDNNGADTDKKGSVKLKALWSNAYYSMSLDESSTTLTLGDLDKNYYKASDFGVTVENFNGVKYDNKDITAYSSNTDVVRVAKIDGDDYIYAKGEGTATVYIFDSNSGSSAAASVTVTKDGTAATEDNTAKLQAHEKVKADNGQTVKLNSDGKTVTVTKGKNQKKVTVNTVVIDGVTYKVTSIAANAFKGMSKVQTVVIGNNVKTIGKLAFANCKNLKKVTMGKNVKKIGAKAFKNDKKLAKVLIKSKKLTTNAKVGSQAFKNTKSGVKFYIAKKAATFKKIKKVIKKKGQPTKAKYVKKYA